MGLKAGIVDRVMLGPVVLAAIQRLHNDKGFMFCALGSIGLHQLFQLE